MPNRVSIECLISSSVSIGDLGVRLTGRGSRAVVLADTAFGSRDLHDAKAKRWVKVNNIREESVRIWPFVKNTPSSPIPIPVSGNQDVVRLLGNIDQKLGELLQRPIATAPEVLAAHMRGLSSMSTVPAGLPGGGTLPGPGSLSQPQFIPSTIVPKDVDSDKIHVKEEKTDRTIDEGVEALKKLRRK